MSHLLQKYLKHCKKLRRANGIAPHKPILLLSILQAFEHNLISDNRIYITPEIVGLFKSNWNALVSTNHDCRISYPFYYMKSEGFWKLIPKEGFDNINKLDSVVKSFSALNAAVDHALIPEELSLLMFDITSNKILQQFLIDNYFPVTKINLQPYVQQLKIFDDIKNKILYEPSLEYSNEIKQLLEEENEEEIFLRGSMFKREIPKIYNNTCCISGMQIIASTNISMIDACHIIPFSENYDDTIGNGIALCPNLHRAFDRGLISVDENYRVLMSPHFKEIANEYGIKKFEGKEILIPKNRIYWPVEKNLTWHRNNCFQLL